MSSEGPRKFNGRIGGSVSTDAGQRRRRRGSFSASLSAVHDGGTVGSLKMSYSGTRRTMTVSSIQNMSGGQVSGVGSALMQRAEHVGKLSGAHTLETTLTAPSAQGFYRKQGLRPDPVMHATIKEAAPELSDEDAAKKVPVWSKEL